MNNTPVKFLSLFRKASTQRGAVFGAILLVALLAFEVFNYSTTDFALTDLLGTNLTFLGLRWATILSIAFCGIDFAGIARLFTPQQGSDEPTEVWYLFGAWILAATMNASLTWWGVAIAINSHVAQGAVIVGRETLFKVIPIFVAVMVWIIRILIIGSFSMAGERLFSMAGVQPARGAISHATNPALRPSTNATYRPVTNSTPSRPASRPSNPSRPVRPEPTYHPVGMAAKSHDEAETPWR